MIDKKQEKQALALIEKYGFEKFGSAGIEQYRYLAMMLGVAYGLDDDSIAKYMDMKSDNIAEIEDKELGRFAKRKGLNIVLRISSYMNAKGLDIRQYQEDSTYTGWTKKGIRLPLEQLKEIKELFTKTAAYFKEHKENK